MRASIIIVTVAAASLTSLVWAQERSGWEQSLAKANALRGTGGSDDSRAGTTALGASDRGTAAELGMIRKDSMNRLAEASGAAESGRGPGNAFGSALAGDLGPGGSALASSRSGALLGPREAFAGALSRPGEALGVAGFAPGHEVATGLVETRTAGSAGLVSPADGLQLGARGESAEAPLRSNGALKVHQESIAGPKAGVVARGALPDRIEAAPAHEALGLAPEGPAAK
ncbi:MAG: hypothetical protein JO069_21555 [Verrucomicrobia bacterium]|nr:hypothetical protein [Verrucomicrobiota bacterium]